MYWGNGAFGGMMSMMGFGMVLWFVFWIAIVALIVYLLFRFLNKRNLDFPVRAMSDPLQILKERYARGEIDEETFLRMKDKLQ